MSTREIALRIPFTTLLKVAAAVLLVAILVKIWPVILMLVIAVLVAVMLDPAVGWLERHGARRGIAIALITVVLVTVLGLFFGGVVPSIGKEVGHLVRDWPRISARLSSSYPALTPILSHKIMPQGSQGAVKQGAVAGMYIVEGVTALIFVLVVAVYLLMEGRLAYAWLASFVPAPQRKKLDLTASEMRKIVLAYMRGQLITSTIGAVFAFVFLTALKVPMALLLAVLAFVGDFLPIVGMIVMTSAAALMALIESPTKAVIVVAGYLAYQAVENYIIVPKVYGKQMRLSTLTVVVAVAIGGTLQGVIGALLAMPIAAAYPVIERIWLRRHLPEDTVPRHEAIENSG